MQPHVLIVDDEKEPREALEFALRRKNRTWTFSTAATVEEAAQLIESPLPDIAPIDVVLTDMLIGHHTEGGIEVLDMAKKKDPLMMVIIFTAQEKSIDRAEIYKIGAFDCIEKTMQGKAAWHEISTKTEAAVHFRRLTLDHLQKQEREEKMRRFFDPRIFSALEKNPGFL
ncbi:MAG: response regulator, partial [Planctomycetota bacterium]